MLKKLSDSAEKKLDHKTIEVEMPKNIRLKFWNIQIDRSADKNSKWHIGLWRSFSSKNI